ncbi:hypothetical protein MY4824_000529 [Beauveria thailandica]
MRLTTRCSRISGPRPTATAALVVCNFSRRRGDVWGLAGTTDVPPREVIVSATGKTKADLGSKIELGPYEAIALLL